MISEFNATVIQNKYEWAEETLILVSFFLFWETMHTKWFLINWQGTPIYPKHRVDWVVYYYTVWGLIMLCLFHCNVPQETSVVAWRCFLADRAHGTALLLHGGLLDVSEIYNINIHKGLPYISEVYINDNMHKGLLVEVKYSTLTGMRGYHTYLK